MDNLSALAQKIVKAKHIVAFTGAGVSTESNIPDFRSAGGVFESIQNEYGYPPEVLLSHEFFESNTEIFFKYLRKYLAFPDALPNDAHKSLAVLERAGKLDAVITQNIDGLHTKAGSRRVYELHGSLYRNYCTACGKKYDLKTIYSLNGIPRCTCGGIVRPDVVLYEERLDDNVVEKSIQAITRADLLIVMGTSLSVYPAAGLIEYFKGSDLVLINKTPTPYDNRAQLIISGLAGETMKQALQLAGIEMA